jgi:hypothetical protein
MATLRQRSGYRLQHVSGANRARLNTSKPPRPWNLSLTADFVEEVGERFETKRFGHSNALDCEPLMVSGWVRAWHRYQLRQLSEILGGCCKKELIARTIRSS